MTIAREEKVYWDNGSLKIEGLLGKHSEENGVVICHPHPLMGGSMHNNVVEAIRDAFASFLRKIIRHFVLTSGEPVTVPAIMTRAGENRKIFYQLTNF